MDLREYQRRALVSGQVPGESGAGSIVPLLGLAGEDGTLLSEYKTLFRDGEAHCLHDERVAEKLGDLLWYLSNVASTYGLDLGAIAEANLAKVHGRSRRRGHAGVGPDGAPLFDGGYPEHERLPRAFEVVVTEMCEGDTLKVQMFVDGLPLGDTLTDNAYDLDGYRYHDAFHLAYLAVLGWSPVMRKLFNRKRKSNLIVDEVEDGGRALVIEEGLSAIVFDYAKDHAFLKDMTALDESIVRTAMSVTANLEVGRCSAGEWELAVFTGFDVWRALVEHRGGYLTVNLDQRSIVVRPTRYDDVDGRRRAPHR